MKTQSFDKYSAQYDDWFVRNKFVFLSEVAAIKKLLPKKGTIIEIGIGSGIFAEALNIKEGVEPSKAMRKRAAKRGIKTINAVAENLPYPAQSIDTIVMITTICFVDDINKTFTEIKRILKKNGKIILAFVDKNSQTGRIYQKNKEKSQFYKEATFFGTEELYEILNNTGFEIKETVQTLFTENKQIKQVQEIENGYGKGSFVVIKAEK